MKNKTVGQQVRARASISSSPSFLSYLITLTVWYLNLTAMYHAQLTKKHITA